MSPVFKRLILLLLLSTVALVNSCTKSESLFNEIEANTNKTETIVSPDLAIDYESYASLLSKYVNNQGLVDYQQLQANRQLLDQFNNSLAAVSPSIFLSWSKEEQIAFLMNAYNSYTLEAIINQEPLKDSIRDIPLVWKRAEYQIVGQKKSLNDIEHGTIRKEYDEPRIHAALVCAAMSCPILRNEPYRAENLDTQLDEQVAIWISDPNRGLQIDRENNTVSISSIFKWYGEDWISKYQVDQGFSGSKKEKAVLNFISNYVSTEDAEYLQKGNYQVKYLDYDWSLNIQPNS